MRLLLWKILQLQNEVRVCDEAPRRFKAKLMALVGMLQKVVDQIHTMMQQLVS